MQAQSLFTKIRWRLLPILGISYIIAYIDRINVGFAKEGIGGALGVTSREMDVVYGFGAGLFFVGYFLCEVPSNLLLQKIGARTWIARIMAFWGAASIAMLFVHSRGAFYVLRFLIGAGEAGFFPGVVYYLSTWFPARYRAANISIFSTGAMLAGVIGSSLSGFILHLDGYGGLAGWQWLFLLGGLPAVAMSLIFLRLLPEDWSGVKWLSAKEKDLLRSELAADEASTSGQALGRVSDVFSSGRVWFFCGLYFLLNISGYGYELWSPTLIRRMVSHSDIGVGFLNAIPYLVSGVVMVVVAMRSDRTGQRGRYVAWAALVAALGFAAAGCSLNPFVSMVALTIGLTGIKSMLGPFWALLASSLKGSGSAAGLALVNSIGNLGGFVGPLVVGKVFRASGSLSAGLIPISGAVLVLSILAFCFLSAGADSVSTRGIGHRKKII